MRILLLTGEYPPMQGGVGDYTWALGTALGDLGVDVHILTSREAGPNHLMPAGVSNVYAEVDKWGWGTMRDIRRRAAEIQPNSWESTAPGAPGLSERASKITPRPVP